MSNDFWWGMFAIPAAALAVGIVLIAIMGVIWASSTWKGDEYKLLPKMWGQRESILVTVAMARWVRYMWVPGLHVVICRTTPVQRESDERWRMGLRLKAAVAQVLKDAS